MNVTEVIRKAGRLVGDGDSVVIEQQDWFDFINDAQLQIIRDTQELTAVDTDPASTFPVTFPTDYLFTKRVKYGNRALQRIRVDDLDGMDLEESYQDTPYFYYFAQEQLFLYPDPPVGDSTTVTHIYTKQPTQVTSTGTALSIPLIHHEDLVCYVKAKAYERLQNYRAYEMAMQEYVNNVGKRMEESLNQDDTYMVIADDPVDVDTVYML